MFYITKPSKPRHRGVGSFPILVRPKKIRTAKRREIFSPPSSGAPGHAPQEIFQNIALRLAQIAFPGGIVRNICFHRADLFQNILNCGGVEKAYLSTEEEKYLQTNMQMKTSF